EAARPCEIVIVLGLEEFAILDHRLAMDGAADRQLVSPCRVRAVGDVVVEVCAQIFGRKVLVHRQGFGRTPVLGAEQGDPAVGMKLLQQGEKFAPMTTVGRGLIDPADELGENRGFELVHSRVKTTSRFPYRLAGWLRITSRDSASRERSASPLLTP